MRFRSWLLDRSNEVRSFKLSSSLYVSSFTPVSADNILPAAFKWGTIIYAILSEFISPASKPVSSINILSPILLPLLITLSPYLTIVRFSPIKGTMSPMVAIATRSSTLFKSDLVIAGLVLRSKAWANLNATPHPDSSFCGYVQSICLGLINMQETILSFKL